MKGLAEPEVYEKGLQYWPYHKSWQHVLDLVNQRSPENGAVLDAMCGPGYLLGQISELRGDLSLEGIDIDPRYIPFAQEKYPQIKITDADILKWSPSQKYDIVLCTGSLHHIQYIQQERAIKRLASFTKPDGLAIIADCYIGNYETEDERADAAYELGTAYLETTKVNGAPDDVIRTTEEIRENDVAAKIEFKTSLKKRLPLIAEKFTSIHTIRMWPEEAAESAYGDYITICRK